MIAFQRSTDW